MSKRKTSVDTFVDGMIKSDQLDSQASYLARGRRLARLSVIELQEHWAQAVRNFADVQTNEHWVAFEDAYAELLLRKIEPDIGPVQMEWSGLIAEIERSRLKHPEGDPAIRRAIRKFMDELDDDTKKN